MPIYPLNEPYDVTAEWYLPDHPERTITGELHYTPGQISLELQDTFAPLEGAIYGNETVSFSRICGQTRSGELFTLINPFRLGTSIKIGGGRLVQPDRFSASMLIVGALTDDNPIVANVSCRVPGLAVWLSRPTIDATYEPADDALTMTFRVASLPAENFRIPALSANLAFNVSSMAKPDGFSLNVTTIGYWRLVPDTPQPLSWYLRHIPAMTAFLSLCAGVTMSPDCITLSGEERNERPSLLVRRPADKYCTITDLRFFFLARETFATQFEKCLVRWFELYPTIETTNALAMSILASDQLWPHVEFLSLMQALEGFHRVQYDGHYMPKDDYTAVADTLVQAIPADVSPDHRASLKSRIRYGNEISLAKRLTLLCESLGEPLRNMLYGNSAKLLRRWIDTRNYYTHWDESLRDQILDGQNLVYAIARLRSLLRVLYLDAIGVPQQAIFQGLTGTSTEAQFLIQIRGIERRAANPEDATGAIMFIQRGVRSSSDVNFDVSGHETKTETDSDGSR